MFGNHKGPDPKPEPRGKKKKQPIRKVAKKRSQEIAEYNPKRDKYLKENPYCEGCMWMRKNGYPNHHISRSNQLHHKKGRENRVLLEIKWWMAMCQTHHDFIDDFPAESEERGWLILRTT